MNHHDPSESRWEQAVVRLIKLTQSGALSWDAVDLPIRPMMSRFVGPQFVAEVEGRRVAAYERAYPVDPEDDGVGTESHTIIEFVDDSLDSVWVWPVPMGLRSELLESIRDRWVDSDGFLDALLGAGT